MTVSHDRLRLIKGAVPLKRYDAAKVELKIPHRHGLGLDGAYWFSKHMDLGADYTNTAAGNDGWRTRSQTEANIHGDMKARSRFDQPHAALLRLTYETPALSGGGGRLKRFVGRWTLSTVALLKSGTPFNVEVGSDAPGYGNVDGTFGDRPNLLDTSVLGRTIGHPDTAQELLPHSAFGFIEPGGEGSLGRYTFRKGGIRNVNLGLSRRWTVHSDTSLTFRAESVNFFNTAQFAEPSARLTDSNFGSITNTLNEGRTFRVGIEAGF